MTWKGIDFHGIVTLDQALIDELRSYLEEKESHIEQALHASNGSKITEEINLHLWEYTEILEGCITELFLQLKSVGFEEWSPGLLVVVDTVNEIIVQKIRQARLSIDLFNLCGRKGRWNPFRRSLVDPAIARALSRSLKVQAKEKKDFTKRYEVYSQLNSKVTEMLGKFSHYHLLHRMDEDVQSAYIRLYKLLKIWQFNQLPPREVIRTIHSAFSIEKASEIFRAYFSLLHQRLFDRSKMLKMGSKELFEDDVIKKMLLGEINGYRAEVHTLGATIEDYRQFFLATHPNPYIRTRWGFPEWLVGAEPELSASLERLVFKIETLDKHYAEISHAIHRGPNPNEGIQLSKLYRDILKTLYEMGQPLTSRSVMKSRTEKIMSLIREMNELGSFNPEVIHYVGRAFSKAMRADWQYHVLFENGSFHQLFEVHCGLEGTFERGSYITREQKFKSILKRMKLEEKYSDASISDLNLYLQEFLSEVQRSIKQSGHHPEEMRKVFSKTAAELLEYRYLFGKFFHFLHQNEPEAKMIRNKFIFVDQYFESIENLIH